MLPSHIVAGRKDSDDLISTYREPNPTPRPAHGLCLLVIGEGLFATHPLPGNGLVTIGRSPECTVRIDLPAISREHAVLHISGAELEIKDLGSSNGTRLRGQQLEPEQTAELFPGDIIELGSTMVIVQHFSAAHPSRRIWTHDYFEWRVDDECARSSRTGLSFTLARIRVVDPSGQGPG